MIFRILFARIILGALIRRPKPRVRMEHFRAYWKVRDVRDRPVDVEIGDTRILVMPHDDLILDRRDGSKIVARGIGRR